MFYIYVVGENFIKVSNYTKISLARKIEHAVYWSSKKTALTWESSIKRKYPNAELKEAKLTLV